MRDILNNMKVRFYQQVTAHVRNKYYDEQFGSPTHNPNLLLFLLLLLNSFIDFKENIQTFYRIIVAHNKVHEVKGKPGLTQHIEGFPVALQY